MIYPRSHATDALKIMPEHDSSPRQQRRETVLKVIVDYWHRSGSVESHLPGQCRFPNLRHPSQRPHAINTTAGILNSRECLEIRAIWYSRKTIFQYLANGYQVIHIGRNRANVFQQTFGNQTTGPELLSDLRREFQETTTPIECGQDTPCVSACRTHLKTSPKKSAYLFSVGNTRFCRKQEHLLRLCASVQSSDGLVNCPAWFAEFFRSDQLRPEMLVKKAPENMALKLR